VVILEVATDEKKPRASFCQHADGHDKGIPCQAQAIGDSRVMRAFCPINDSGWLQPIPE
jgi:hypothetical protein